MQPKFRNGKNGLLYTLCLLNQYKMTIYLIHFVYVSCPCA